VGLGSKVEVIQKKLMHQIVKGTQHWDQFVVLVMIFKRDFDG
jgi:hypothetical protein